MTSRAEKLGRMVSLMKLQLRLSEWQLAQLRQQESEFRDHEAYLVGALNGDTLPTGSSSESISRRLTTASVGARTAQTQAARALELVRAESRRVKQVEQVAKAATVDRVRDTERRSLEELAAFDPGARDWMSIVSKRGVRK